MSALRQHDAHRPADAYFIVAALLTEAYFQHRPPERGTRLMVTGLDGIPTSWDFHADTGDELYRRLLKRRDVRRVERTSYYPTAPP